MWMAGWGLLLLVALLPLGVLLGQDGPARAWAPVRVRRALPPRRRR